METTPNGADGVNVAERMGFAANMVVQELGWDEDAAEDVRAEIEEAIVGDMVDGEYGNVVDAVVLWWRDGDGDLVDALVDSLTDLVAGGAIWLMTPKLGRPDAVEPADVTEAAPVAGLATTNSLPVAKDWVGTRLVTPKSRRVAALTAWSVRSLVAHGSAAGFADGECGEGVCGSARGRDLDEPAVELEDDVPVDGPRSARSQCADWMAASSWNRPSGRPSECARRSSASPSAISARSHSAVSCSSSGGQGRPVRAGARDCAKVSSAARPHASGSVSSSPAVSTASHRASSATDSWIRSCWSSQSIAYAP